MRRTIGILVGTAAAAAVAGCGGGKQFANNPRPAPPVNLTVYINDSRVSVSPDSLGAGPVVFIVTNQASHAESLQVHSASGNATGQPITTGPINPQATATVTADLKPGDYLVATGSDGGTQAASATQAVIHPAQLHLGTPRASGKDLLLQP
jgi:uncharacterized iron-regulated membrane protein